MKRVRILGHPFDVLHKNALLLLLEERVTACIQTRLSFANPEHVLRFLDSTMLQKYTQSCDYILPDGSGILWASRELKKYNNNVSISERITGTEFAEDILKLGNLKKWKICLYGGSEEVKSILDTKFTELYPALQFLVIPGFPPHSTEAVSAIQKFDPVVLMVCLGNPLQENWILENTPSLNASILFGNGGAMDFLAGLKIRAPESWQNLGIEWLWRIFQDFTLKRLLRILALPKFVFLVERKKFFNR